MRFIFFVLISVSLFFQSSFAFSFSPQPHPCAEEAIKQAQKLLLFHSDQDDRATVDDRVQDVELLKPIKAAVGKGSFDVLQVNGSIYKGNYRMRLIYAQIPDMCVLMGQEILELSDPY